MTLYSDDWKDFMGADAYSASNDLLVVADGSGGKSTIDPDRQKFSRMLVGDLNTLLHNEYELDMTSALD